MAGPIRDFKSTDDGEWAIVNGDFANVAGADAVPQGVRIRLGMFLGEVYLDETIGVDWIDSIMVKNPDPLLIRALLQAPIAETPDVVEVVGAQLLRVGSSREGTIAYECSTIYSSVLLSEQVGVP